MTSIVWFRQDLRINDNPALTAACSDDTSIIPLYIHDLNVPYYLGAAQKWWLHHSLISLMRNFNAKGINFCIKDGDTLAILRAIIKQYNVKTVYWNICFEPKNQAFDEALMSTLRKEGIDVFAFNASLLITPNSVKNQQNAPYKVFTPFWRACLRQIATPSQTNPPKKFHTPNCSSNTIESLNLLPHPPDWSTKFGQYWQPGEDSAHNQLSQFINNELQNYAQDRDLPSKSATSYLSPHLHFGEIGPWQIWRALNDAKHMTSINTNNIDKFLTELGWREFSYYLLHHFPNLPSKNFQSKFDKLPWNNNTELLAKWQTGRTGYPIVDAGMRELWRTGYMHNRVRMIAASFLTKDLLIDWRIGADWFLDTLLDADLASNSASWQWVAGCGCDAAPYFRIFNPVLQGEKFDPKGEYIRKWIPELANVSSKWIHKPWLAPTNEKPMHLEKSYPLPIINHDAARRLALDIYEKGLR